MIPENHGYQVIHRLQMGRNGREFGNEFRYRTSPLDLAGRRRRQGSRGWTATTSRSTWCRSPPGSAPARVRANTAAEVRAALDETRGHQGPVVIVVPVIPHVDLPGAGVWWDVAPSEVSEDETVQRLRTEYEAGLSKQLWLG